MRTPINLKILSRDRLTFEGQVSSVSSTNDKGVFDILSNHSNFISLISEQITFVDTKTNLAHKIPIGGRAILKSIENSVEIYIGM